MVKKHKLLRHKIGLQGCVHELLRFIYLYRVFPNECPKTKIILHQEEIHFMRANWMKTFNEIDDLF